MRHIIYNITIILTFAALALCFSKWWIILFALFFMVTGTAFKKTNAKHCRVCDEQHLLDRFHTYYTLDN